MCPIVTLYTLYTINNNSDICSADNVILQRQVDLSLLYFHVHEPIHVPEHVKIAKTWAVDKNIDKYTVSKFTSSE